jgi:hypothetical protein
MPKEGYSSPQKLKRIEQRQQDWQERATDGFTE